MITYGEYLRLNWLEIRVGTAGQTLISEAVVRPSVPTATKAHFSW